MSDRMKRQISKYERTIRNKNRNAVDGLFYTFFSGVFIMKHWN